MTGSGFIGPAYAGHSWNCMFFQNNEERKNEKTNVQMTVTADDIWVLSILASQEHKSKVANKNIHSA